MPAWLGIDHGHKRVGIAIGNIGDSFAAPVKVIPGQDIQQVYRQIGKIAEEYNAKGAVVGWPLNMDDTEGPQGKSAREFAHALAEKTGLDVRMWDERLSSFTADLALAGHLTRGKRKTRQDAIAAADFLGEFLRQNGIETAPKPDEVVEEPKK